MWPLFFTFQILMLFLLNLVYVPQNVETVLKSAKGMMELDAVKEPKKIISKSMGKSVKSILALDPLLLVLYVGVPCLIVLGLLVFLMTLCCKKCPKIRGIFKSLFYSIFFGVIIKAY